MIVPLSTQIMVNSHYGKRLKLFQFYLIITSAIFIEYHECRRDYTNCCEILKIISSSFLAKFHPEHLGSYKLMKNSKNVYISLTEPNSYIYLLSLGKGNSDVLNIELCTGKSLSEALIFASTNPQYDDKLFIELRVQYMKITSSEHVVYINCFLFLF